MSEMYSEMRFLKTKKEVVEEIEKVRRNLIEGTKITIEARANHGGMFAGFYEIDVVVRGQLRLPNGLLDSLFIQVTSGIYEELSEATRKNYQTIVAGVANVIEGSTGLEVEKEIYTETEKELDREQNRSWREEAKFYEGR